ncbi:MAG: YkgJ family cysteine cluster protein [Gammaproteobacteria bacterium]|jgi:uncharacterized protein|nr:YkgJ family cysteine cluster protein [Gammaproteobacteria bacterium]
MQTPFELPVSSPAIPTQLNGSAKIQFSCHKGVSCFNECCKQADIPLTSYDVIRLKGYLGLSSTEFLKEHTYPFEMDNDRLPGVKLRHKDESTTCHFMTEEGCSVYEHRPMACRYYPVGHLSLRKQNVNEEEEHYFLVKESYCKGHEEDRELTIDEYRKEQQVEEYDKNSHMYRRLILKKKSGGPAIGTLSKNSLSFYFMATYDIDRFRDFVLSEGFEKAYEIPEDELVEAIKDDMRLLELGDRLMRQIFFGEKLVKQREGAWEERSEKRKHLWDARTKDALAERHKREQDMYTVDKEDSAVTGFCPDGTCGTNDP